jgi:SEC-C motif domain protein
MNSDRRPEMTKTKNCPCGSNKAFAECCEPLLKGDRLATNPEELMRSRYTAYVVKKVKYIFDTSLPELRKTLDENATKDWSERSAWEKLEIVSTDKGGAEDKEGTVEFKAHFTIDKAARLHHERATFKKYRGRWYYADGEMVIQKPFVREEPKVGRNDPCPCGSGKKYKKCCGK